MVKTKTGHHAASPEALPLPRGKTSTAERLRDPAHAASTRDTLRSIASHELDPYSAADRLLASLGEDAPG